MRIELFTIGDELLDGVVTDTHTTTIARALDGLGLSIDRVTTLRDDLDVLTAALREVAARADLCLLTGGLGPTADDLTVDALAAAAEVPLEEDPAVWAQIQRIFGDRPIAPSNRRQARIPVGGRALSSEVGTAPGVELRVGRCLFVALPGVPREMVWHLERHVLPIVDGLRGAAPTLHHRTLKFVGIGESDLASLVEAAALPASVEVGYRTALPENHVRLRGPDPGALQAAVDVVLAVAGDRFVGEGRGLVEAVLAELGARGLTLGAAESCTGGLLGATITDVAGASAVFVGSVVSYANSVKQGVLKVPEAVLRDAGAVSEACARAMAVGARAALGCDVAVSITGIAGPGGGTEDKPVGTVCFGWQGPDLALEHTRHYRGDRDRVRRLAVGHALDVVRRHVTRAP
ncbi:MAG: CinA family nicotinamide mononucleotide deamidase-related protein [Myxococcales bacterium]|nr:CinA family nicotinamide mononucleotide deamidase-related protein [Myxococcales bacterium]